MSNDLLFPNTLYATSSSKFKPEKIYMITESRAEQLESIAEEIEKYEKWEPRWDIQKNLMSFCGAIALSGIGIILGEGKLKYEIIIYSATIGSIAGFIICLASVIMHHKEIKEKYTFQASKLKNIMAKVRQSIENK